jgi:hypothetical protein
MRPLKNRASAVVALMAGGVLLLGAPAVYADTNLNSEDNAVLSGNQAVVDADAPVTICGNAALLAAAECEAEVDTGDEGSGDTNMNSEDNAVISGNQAVVDADAPVTVCGNAVGAAAARCKADIETGDEGRGDRNLNSEDNAVVSGNQAVVDADAPVTVCGNAIGAALAECEAEIDTGDEGSGDTNLNSEDNAVLSGNQLVADLAAPVTVCGNAALIAAAGCEVEVETGDEGDENGHDDGDNGHDDNGRDNGHDSGNHPGGHSGHNSGDNTGAGTDDEERAGPVTKGVSELPHTGIALVLVPLGLALLAGGAALRRRMSA